MTPEVYPDGQEKRYRYRITVFGEPRTSWAPTAGDAMADAIAANLASVDEEGGEHYLAVPVALVRELAPRMTLSTRSDARPWNRDDIATLREQGPKQVWPVDIGRRLGRTEDAVIAKARRLGIELRTAARDHRMIAGAVAEIEARGPKKRKRVPRELRGRTQSR